MILRIVIFAGLFFVIGVAAETASACTCPPIWRDNSAEAIKRVVDGTDYVFSARVVSIRKGAAGRFSPPGQIVTLRIIRRWKGVTGSIKNLTTSSGPTSMCNYPFRTGKEYLVYARRDPTKRKELAENNEVLTSLCSRTQLLAEAAADLSVLNPTERN